MNLSVQWGSVKIYVPNEVHTALLESLLLESRVNSGTVTVLSSERDFEGGKNEQKQSQISVLKND